MVSKVVKALTGVKKPKAMKIVMPEEKPATPMPDEEELARIAKMNELHRKRTGRSSTLLSDDEEQTL